MLGYQWNEIGSVQVEIASWCLGSVQPRSAAKLPAALQLYFIFRLTVCFRLRACVSLSVIFYAGRDCPHNTNDIIESWQFWGEWETQYNVSRNHLTLDAWNVQPVIWEKERYSWGTSLPKHIHSQITNSFHAPAGTLNKPLIVDGPWIFYKYYSWA